VLEDWIAALPREKGQLFEAVVRPMGIIVRDGEYLTERIAGTGSTRRTGGSATAIGGNGGIADASEPMY